MKLKYYLYDIRVRAFMIGLAITLLLYSAFFFGATYSCSVGGGVLLGFPLPECNEMKVVQACQDDKGTAYDIGSGYTDPYNISWGKL